MGQGMSHHASSLLHAGGLCTSCDAVDRCTIIVSGKLAAFTTHIMVTSDDSTVMPETKSTDISVFLTPSQC